ncbi:UNVERIFIED_CONTAM: hypothetical protein Sradi_4517000 [Sesamum radiatum]|uniref:Uncharacterized protein n=1 Tax=Sesamum radiatum TaxID=300843 RepID=A0AAW2NAV0_SESRA
MGVLDPARATTPLQAFTSAAPPFFRAFLAKAFYCPERPVSVPRRAPRGCGVGRTSRHTLCPAIRVRPCALGPLDHGVVARSLGCGKHGGYEAPGLCLPRIKRSTLRANDGDARRARPTPCGRGRGALPRPADAPRALPTPCGRVARPCRGRPMRARHGRLEGSRSPGVEQSTQNWYGQGESDCLIKTKHCDGRGARGRRARAHRQGSAGPRARVRTGSARARARIGRPRQGLALSIPWRGSTEQPRRPTYLKFENRSRALRPRCL